MESKTIVAACKSRKIAVTVEPRLSEKNGTESVGCAIEAIK